jgi:TetR/AcrR family acrAB operon transcriptional repressor
MARKTKEEALVTRCAILDTAERVFRERGVGATSLAAIATAAGVTRGAIYWHFRNKNDLLMALFERVSLPMEQMLAAAAIDTEDPFARLRELSIQVLRLVTRDERTRCVFETMLTRCERTDEIAALTQRQMHCRADAVQVIQGIFRDAVRRGSLPPGVNPRRAAIGLVAYVDGLIYDWLTDPAGFDLAREAPPLVDQFLDGLRCAAAAVAGGRAA